MKVAICYDNLISQGGHERIILTLAKAFNADIYTMKFDPENTFPEFKNYNVYTNELKYNIQGLKLLRVIHSFRNLDLSDYDFVISNGGWSRQVAINKGNHTIIDYNPGPPGYFKYETYSENIIKKTWLKYIKKLDYESAEMVSCLIPNSVYVKNIFEECYAPKKISDVVYPPIDCNKFMNKKSENFYLSVQRISQQKRIELQIEVFTKLDNENLIILGVVDDKEYFNRLSQAATNNINFITDVNDEKISELYSKCKSVIQTGKGEPFGIVPIEAMASGKPCIAVNEGGFKETIIDNETGLLIDRPYVDNFVDAIKNFDSYSFNPEVCQKRAMLFSEKAFIEKINSIVNSIL
jgi:glycosyltransferase involved in cell wall biosynthesis